MSQLLYTALSHADHEWLSAGDRALKIDGGLHDGKVVKINITQQQRDMDSDGQADHLAARVSASIVDELTGAVVLIGESEVRTPVQVHTLAIDALAEEQDDVILWISTLTDDAIHRALRVEASLNAWTQIPI